MKRWYGPQGGAAGIWEALGGDPGEDQHYRVARLIADKCSLTAPGIRRIISGTGQQPRAETLVAIYGTLPAVAADLEAA